MAACALRGVEACPASPPGMANGCTTTAPPSAAMRAVAASRSATRMTGTTRGCPSREAMIPVSIPAPSPCGAMRWSGAAKGCISQPRSGVGGVQPQGKHPRHQRPRRRRAIVGCRDPAHARERVGAAELLDDDRIQRVALPDPPGCQIARIIWEPVEPRPDHNPEGVPVLGHLRRQWRCPVDALLATPAPATVWRPDYRVSSANCS